MQEYGNAEVFERIEQPLRRFTVNYILKPEADFMQRVGNEVGGGFCGHFKSFHDYGISRLIILDIVFFVHHIVIAEFICGGCRPPANAE